jgi:hypothetical protein
MKRCLRSSSFCILVFVLFSCGKPYTRLEYHPIKDNSAFRYKPVFEKQLYRCVVDGHFLFKKFHLSGLLFFKKLEDKSTRVVFQNEMGISLFDFEWDKNDSFKVNQVIPQLDKPAVLKILEKDLSLLMMKRLEESTEVAAEKDNVDYSRFTLNKGYAYYISEKGELKQIENTGKKKSVTSITINGKRLATAMPDSVFFKHHKAHFSIQLNHIEQHADE